MSRSFALGGVIGAIAVLASYTAVAQGKGFAPTKSKDEFEKLGQIFVGLVPVYPNTARCPPVASGFGATTRYDGSARVNDHYGFHNGIDISAKDGTPLLAIAAGEVVHGGRGGTLVGNYVWLRHTPDDTGLPVYLFSRYQHLDAPSPHPVGTRLKLGEAVGPAGRTGTAGTYFGPAGYAHLHLLVFAADGAEFQIRDAVVEPPNRRFLDPIAIYMKSSTTFNNHALRALSESEKRVAIPYQAVDGSRQPENTRFVWPIACAPG